MGYRYETHLHTCQGSKCGRATGAEQARFYKEAGYQGVIITDHFCGGNTAMPKEGSWKERIDLYCKGYEDALEEGKKIGLDVFFGFETIDALPPSCSLYDTDASSEKITDVG